jgi:hypothetical protein
MSCRIVELILHVFVCSLIVDWRRSDWLWAFLVSAVGRLEYRLIFIRTVQ